MGQTPTKKACQVEDLLSNLQNEPSMLVLIAFLVVVVAFLFLFPKFTNDTYSFNLASLRDSESGKLILPNIKSSAEKIRKNWVAVVAVVIALSVAGGAALFLYIQNTPVLILSARHFLILERSQVELLKTAGSYAEIYDKGDLLFFDTRDASSYFIAHAQGAENVKPSQFIEVKDLSYPKDKRVVLYGSKSQFDQLRVVAEKIRQAGAEKVYIIKDGIDGFKGAGYPLGEKIPTGLLRTRLVQL